MNRVVLGLVFIVFVGCTAPRAAPRADALRSGEETAKTAADAARAAATGGNTGAIIASSNPPAAVPDAAPIVAPLRVNVANAQVTVDGSPVSDFKALVTDALAAKPDLQVLIEHSEADATLAAELADTARDSGVTIVTIAPATDGGTQAPERAVDAPDAPPKERKDP